MLAHSADAIVPTRLCEQETARMLGSLENTFARESEMSPVQVQGPATSGPAVWGMSDTS